MIKMARHQRPPSQSLILPMAALVVLAVAVGCVLVVLPLVSAAHPGGEL